MTGRAAPHPDPDSEPFWAAARGHRLAIQRCRSCARFQHPPGPVCRSCQGRGLAFEEVSGRATLYTYTRIHHPPLPDFTTPYVVAIVELVEQAGLRLLANLDASAEIGLDVGAPLEVWYMDLADGVTLPQFRLVR